MTFNLVPDGKPVQLCHLDSGILFQHGTTIAMTSEYSTENRSVEAFIVGSGERFWGGTSDPQEQRTLVVQPLRLAQVVASCICANGMRVRDFAVRNCPVHGDSE